MTKINVEVIFALPGEQEVINVELQQNSTVEEAINESKIIEKYTEINLDINKIGIFGKAAKKEDVLHSGDRVEIYRPLIGDPKEIRRQRAKKK